MLVCLLCAVCCFGCGLSDCVSLWLVCGLRLLRLRVFWAGLGLIVVLHLWVVVLGLRVFVVIVVVASVWFRLIAILCMVGYCDYLC